MARRYAPCVKKAAKRSCISPSKLQKSYNRGIGAFKNPGPSRPNMRKEQWACARVNKLARLKTKAGYDQDLLR